MSNIDNLNVNLVRAIGIDTKNVRCVTLIMEVGKIPTILIEKFIVDNAAADGLQTAVEMLRLHLVQEEE